MRHRPYLVPVPTSVHSPFLWLERSAQEDWSGRLLSLPFEPAQVVYLVSARDGVSDTAGHHVPGVLQDLPSGERTGAENSLDDGMFNRICLCLYYLCLCLIHPCRQHTPRAGVWGRRGGGGGGGGEFALPLLGNKSGFFFRGTLIFSTTVPIPDDETPKKKNDTCKISNAFPAT